MQEISSKPVSIVFGGTSRLGEALVIFLRFLDNWEIQQHLIQLQILVKSITGEELAREILGVLCREYKLSTEQVLVSMKDQASVNNVTIRHIKNHVPHCVAPGLKHFNDKFSASGELGGSVAAFKAARLAWPQKMVEIPPTLLIHCRHFHFLMS